MTADEKETERPGIIYFDDPDVPAELCLLGAVLKSGTLQGCVFAWFALVRGKGTALITVEGGEVYRGWEIRRLQYRKK